jgi:hypothetical protein
MTQGAIPGGGLLRVVTNKALDEKARADYDARAATQTTEDDYSALCGFIRQQYEIMRLHRDNPQSGWADRLLHAMRCFNGQYAPEQLAEIQRFGGSTVYARIIAVKARAASSLLRDVYLGTERSWGLSPPTDPPVPDNIHNSIQSLVNMEVQGAAAAGQPIEATSIRDRINQLTEAARQAAKKKAAGQCQIAEDKLDEILQEGGFYKALAEFIVDLPLFPYAVIKGPVVRIVPEVKWDNGQPTTVNKPKLFWQRVSPFDLYWTPGASDIEEANVIERSRVTRAELNDLLDLPGYNHDAIRAVLDEYGRGGLNDNWDIIDQERAVHESRENPHINRSGMISCLEFQGNVQGKLLLEQGIPEDQIPDPVRDYFVQGWMIGRHIIKVQLAPSPRKRHQYYVSSFEKVPGTPVGNGLPDILADIQDVSNATLRSLVNNMSISSGPQVVVNDDRLSDDEDGEELYPWKRWHMTSDPMGNNANPPVSFFQPNSNAQELMAIYSTLTNMADELSAIPRYLTGGQSGSVGRTASGLSMLMGNASKVLQTVAANIDRDIFDPLLSNLYDMVMLTDTSGLLSGDEDIRIMGVNVAIQKETQRARQLEFLQATANPIDMQIIGPKGRAAVLRPVAESLGLPGEEIVPSSDELDAQQHQAAMLAQAQGQPGHSQGADQAQQAQGQGATGNQSPVTKDIGPRTRIAGGP